MRRGYSSSTAIGPRDIIIGAREDGIGTAPRAVIRHRPRDATIATARTEVSPPRDRVVRAMATR